MKHKHAEVLHAFADGIECETWYGSKWIKTTSLMDFDSFEKVRIKPEPKPDVVRYGYISSPDMKNINLTFCSFEIDNLKLTFDGETGELKYAEVIK